MSFRTRLRRLHDHARRQGLLPSGCPACRDRRGRIVLVDAQRRPDGMVVAASNAPQPCPACGELPEYLIEVIETVVAPEEVA